MIDALLTRYKTHIQRHGVLRNLIELGVLSILIKTLPGLILSFIVSGPIQTTTDFQLQHEDMGFVILTAIVIAPPIETVLGQWLPLAVLSLVFQKMLPLVVGSSVWFGFWHLYAGWHSVLIVMFPGMVFSFCFIALWECSFWKAYWMTTLVHALHNLLSLLVYFFIAV